MLTAKLSRRFPDETVARGRDAIEGAGRSLGVRNETKLASRLRGCTDSTTRSLCSALQVLQESTRGRGRRRV